MNSEKKIVCLTTLRTFSLYKRKLSAQTKPEVSYVALVHFTLSTSIFNSCCDFTLPSILHKILSWPLLIIFPILTSIKRSSIYFNYYSCSPTEHQSKRSHLSFIDTSKESTVSVLFFLFKLFKCACKFARVRTNDHLNETFSSSTPFFSHGCRMTPTYECLQFFHVYLLPWLHTNQNQCPSSFFSPPPSSFNLPANISSLLPIEVVIRSYLRLYYLFTWNLFGFESILPSFLSISLFLLGICVNKGRALAVVHGFYLIIVRGDNPSSRGDQFFPMFTRQTALI